jgi:hypothetical protein
VAVDSKSKDVDQILNHALSKIRAKEWANGRGDIEGTPQYFIKQAERISKEYGTKLTVIEGEKLLD